MRAPKGSVFPVLAPGGLVRGPAGIGVATGSAPGDQHPAVGRARAVGLGPSIRSDLPRFLRGWSYTLLDEMMPDVAGLALPQLARCLT